MAKKINEMGLASDRINRMNELRFDKFKKFFENLYMMPGISCYLYDYEIGSTSNKWYFKKFKIYGEQINPNEKGVNYSSNTNGFYHLQGRVWSRYCYGNLTDFYNFLFVSNDYLQIKYAKMVDEYPDVYFGIADLEDFEIDQLCKVGFQKDMFKDGEESEETVVITLPDLYANIDEIYELFYD